MAELNNAQDLSTPGEGRRFGFGRRVHIDSETFGRFAEWIARFMGSPTFLIWMSIFIVFWLVWNFVAPPIARFDDPSSFILLTFVLSIEAAYSAPLILLAQNRQEARDRLSFDEDRRIAAQSRADTDFLAREIASLRAQMGEIATRDFIRSEIRDQLRDLLAELDHEDDNTEAEENN